MTFGPDTLTLFDPFARSEPDRPLSAQGVMEAVKERVTSMVRGTAADDTVLSLASNELLTAISGQLAVRGTSPSFARELVDGVRFSVDWTSGVLTLSYTEEWLNKLDRALLNHLCQRCGSLVSSALAHSQSSCDDSLVLGVLEA